jgi:DNA-binding CsgD family transcriptional regulator
MPGPASEMPLVGRELELRVVLDTARKGEMAAAVIAGPAGVGKTRLLREVATRVERSGRSVISLTGTSAARAIPFGALAPVLDEADVGTNQLAQVRRELLRRAGDRRLLATVDDAHLLDGPTALVLWQLASEQRITVIATVRSGEPVPDEVRALWKEGGGVRIDVEPLSEADTGRLCQVVLVGEVDPVLTSLVHGLSGGLPLFVRELLVGAVAAGDVTRGPTGWTATSPFRVPARVTDLVGARLDALDPASREALELVALAEPIPLGWLDQMGAAGTLEDLERRGLVVTRSTQRAQPLVWLGHPLSGDLLREAIPQGRRRHLVQRLADVVQADAPSAGVDHVRIVRWRLDAGLAVDTAALEVAAQQLLRSGDYRGAAELAGMAWNASRTVVAGQLVGRLLAAADQGREAEAVLSAVEAMEVGDDAAITALAIIRSDNLQTLGDDSGALDVARAALDRVTAERERRSLLAHVCYLEVSRGHAELALPLLEPLLDSDDPATVVTAANVAELAYTFDARPQAAAELAERSYPVHDQLWAERVLLHEPQVHLVRRGYALIYLGRLDEADEAAAELFRFFLDTGIPVGLPIAALLRGVVALEQGRLATADLWLTRSAEYFVRHDRAARRRWALAPLLLVAARRGDLARARALTVELDGLTALRMLEPVALAGRGWLAWREGRPRDAEQLLRTAVEEAWATASRTLGINALHDLSVLGFGADGPGDVGDVEGPLLGAKLDAVAAAARKDPLGLEAAGATFERLGANLAAAEAFGQAAAVTERDDSTRAARLFARAGACEARCEGVTAEALSAGTLGRLTARELEVARLAAAGLASKRIASDLDVSRRTVDNLLSRAYGKLGINSRGELPDALRSIRS